MRFEIKKREKEVKFPQEEFAIARKFTKLLYKEFGDLLKAVVLFGSVAREKIATEKDIDILIILDDVRIVLTKELIQTYRIILEKIVAEVDPRRLHIQSMKLTSFWEYIRVGDPVAINILRYGISLLDTGFFDPLQALLDEGRIRPTKESVYTYFTMAPASLHRSKQHILTAMVDLYWATVDAAHAALMHVGEIPPSPEHVADLLEQKLVKKRLIKKENVTIMRRLYYIFKQITHRKVSEISGVEYDTYKKQATKFVKEMQKFIEKKEK